MYRQKDLTCITRNIHVKYQTSSTQCIKVSNKVKASDRFTECQKDGRQKDSCKYRDMFYTKKKPKLVLFKFFWKYDKNNTFIFAKCPKISKAVGKWEKCWQNLCRNCCNMHDTNHLYPTNITSKRTISRIVDKIFEGIDSFSKLIICIWNY